jgi:D-amino-acid oxidase
MQCWTCGRYPIAWPETTEDILRRGLALCPELVPQHVRAARRTTALSVEDLRPIIVEEGCGFRPARRGGIRLEVDWVSAGPTSTLRVPIVFNYGCVIRIFAAWKETWKTRRHAGYGFQSSWGSAGIALRLLEGALEKGEVAKDTLNASAAPHVMEGGQGARLW